MRTLFGKQDSLYIQKSIHIVAYLGVFGHLLFYFILRFVFDFWESWQLRFAIAGVYASFLLLPKEGKLRPWQLAYFLGAVAVTLPGGFTFMLLKNGCNVYWFTSMVFAGLLYGLLTKPRFYLLSYVLASGAATWGFSHFHPGSSDLIQESLQVQLVAVFLGLVATGIMAGVEITLGKIMEARVALAHAEEELKRAEETRLAYEELKKREELIRMYVRPSLVDEIHAGHDPSGFRPVLRDLTIMFCDIRGFTRLTEVLNPYERQTFLNHYFSMMTRPIVENGGEVDKIIGDSVMGVFPDGNSAARAAIDMRLELQKFNQGTFAEGKAKIRNGIGIAKGEVMQGNFGSYEKMDRTVIGEAVNIASRLESKTKMYSLDIVVTEDVIKDLAPGFSHYRWIDIVQVKGSTRHLKLYELYGHQPPEVRRYKDSTRDMLEKALTIYFRKGFKDAARLFKAMLEQVPPHRLTEGDRMDHIIQYYLVHCDAWINDRSGAWEQIERWDGVHVFFEK